MFKPQRYMEVIHVVGTHGKPRIRSLQYSQLNDYKSFAIYTMKFWRFKVTMDYNKIKCAYHFVKYEVCRNESTSIRVQLFQHKVLLFERCN